MAFTPNNGQQRVLDLLIRLSGNELDGVSLTSLARGIGESPQLTLKDLKNLEHAGFAEQLEENDRWRLTTKPVRIAMNLLQRLDGAERRYKEIRHRYTRTD